MIMTLYYDKLFGINAKNTKEVNKTKKQYKDEIRARVGDVFGVRKCPKNLETFISTLKKKAFAAYNKNKNFNVLSELDQIIIANEPPVAVEGLKIEPLGLQEISKFSSYISANHVF